MTPPPPPSPPSATATAAAAAAIQPIPPPPFDLLAYISRYDPSSETRLQRLLFLAHYFHNQSINANNNTTTAAAAAPGNTNGNTGDDEGIARLAFELAVEQMKESGNWRRYLEEFGAVLPDGHGGGSDPEMTLSPNRGMHRLDSNNINNIHNTIHTGGNINNNNSNQQHSNQQQQQQHSNHHHQQQQHTIIHHYLPYDPLFPQTAKQSSQLQLEALDARLATAQSHVLKESIRTAYLALGEFHRRRGELRESWRRVMRSREFGGGGGNTMGGGGMMAVCLMLVELGIDLREWSSVRDTIARAEHTALVRDNTTNNNNTTNTSSSSMAAGYPIMHQQNHQDNNTANDNDALLFHPKLRAALALTHLAEGRYLDSAQVFTSISTELTNQYPSVISAEDLAMYGALLGLATLSRERLHELVIDGVFKARLELVPNMRDALRHYSRAEYGQCLSLLQHTLQRDLLLDIHLHSHVPILLDLIRDRCIVQYFQPYSSVSLKTMGTVFGCHSVEEMERIVARLLLSRGNNAENNGGFMGSGEGGGVVLSLGEGARINSLEKTLSVEGNLMAKKKARRRARVMAAKMGVQFARNAEGVILRVACLENGVVIRGTDNPENRRGGRSGRGRGNHNAGRNNAMEDHNMGQLDPDPFDSSGTDDDVVLDAMEIDDHVGNPNDF